MRDDVRARAFAQGIGEPRDHRVGVLQQAVITEGARLEAAAAQARGQPAHGDAAHPQPVHQHDGFAHASRGWRRNMNSRSLLAHREFVFAGEGEAVARVEALRAGVLRPTLIHSVRGPSRSSHAIAASISARPVPPFCRDRRRYRRFELAVAGAHRPHAASRTGRPAHSRWPRRRVRRSTARSRVRQRLRVGPGGVAFVEEMPQILRLVQMAEGFDEGRCAEFGEDFGVGGNRAADGGFPLRLRAGEVGRVIFVFAMHFQPTPTLPSTKGRVDYFSRTCTCTSASCLSGTGEGAPVIRHCAVVVLGRR